MTSSTIRLLLGCSCCLGLLWGPAAATAQDLTGPRSTGMGGTLRAAPSGEAALLLNPAGMTLRRSYLVNALYQYRGSDSGSQLNLSVVDSATKRIAAGMYYSFMQASPSRTFTTPGTTPFILEEKITTHETGLAMAFPLANLVHLGMTGKYVRISVEQPEGTPETSQDSGDNGFTMDFGAIVTPIQMLHLAATFFNAIPIENDAYSRQLGLGAALTLGPRFLAEFNAVLDFDRAEKVKASYHGGAEVFFGSFYALRGGGMHDTIRNATFATGGLGIISKRIALDFGMRQMVAGGTETLLSFSTRVFLQ